jgi:hypothetical protein
VLQFPLLQHLAGMLGHGKRHRGLQSRPLRSGATLPAVGRTPWLTAFESSRLRPSKNPDLISASISISRNSIVNERILSSLR